MQLRQYFRKRDIKYAYVHLIRNVQSNGNPHSISSFIKCINKYHTPQDFKVSWQEPMSYYGVYQKTWTIDLYNDQEKWAKAYLHEYFFTGISIIILTQLFIIYIFLEIYLTHSLSITVGMSTTQRVKSMHRIIKVGLDSNIQLYKLIQLLEQVIPE